MPRNTPTGAECVRLYRSGLRVAAIARQLGITKQAVSQHLRNAGIDATRRRDAAERAGRQRFAAVWGKAPTAEAAAEALGLTEWQMRRKASKLRRLGVPLKAMPGRYRGPPPGPKTLAVWELLRQGVPAAEI